METWICGFVRYWGRVTRVMFKTAMSRLLGLLPSNAVVRLALTLRCLSKTEISDIASLASVDGPN
jgi:hypothetical protein